VEEDKLAVGVEPPERCVVYLESAGIDVVSSGDTGANTFGSSRGLEFNLWVASYC
jgi:hypothetical protein